jgi:MYXO-CTERM domain-containing protein
MFELAASYSDRSLAERVSSTSGWVKDGLSGFAVSPGRLALALGLVGLLLGWRRRNKRLLVASALVCVAGLAAVVLLGQ